MAEEIGALRAVLALESAAFDRGAKSARRTLDVLEGGMKRTSGQVQQFGAAMDRQAGSFTRLGRSVQGTSGGLQNFGFQVQDIAVQIAGGTSASRALAQQLPQLLSGFGLLGIALGTATAIAIPLGAALFGTGQEAKTASKAVDEFGANLDRYEAFVVTAASSTAELTAKFGDFAGQVRGFSEYLAGVAIGQTLDGLLSTVTALNAPLQDVRDRFVTLAEAKAQLARISNEDTYGLFTAREAVAAAQDSLDAAGAALGLTAQQALVLADAIDAVGRAEGVRDVAFAASEALAVMESLVPSGRQLPPPLRDAAFALGEMASRAGEVAKENSNAADAILALNSRLADAYGLYANLRSQAQALAQDNFAAQAQFNRGNQVYSGRGGDPRQFTGTGPQPFVPSADVVAASNAIFSPAKGSGGGGGGRGPSEAEREAARIFKETRTEAEKYAAEVENLSSLLGSGAITQDTYNRAIDNLNGSLSDASSYAQSLEGSFESAFTSFVTGASSAREAAAALLSQLSSLFAQSAFRSLIGGGGFFGGLAGLLANANGNAFSGGRVAAFASGGIVTRPTIFPMARGAGLMGEAGPEAIMPLTRVGGKLGVRAEGGGRPVINIDARGAVEGTAAQIERALARVLPGVVKQSVSANRAAEARGYR